MSDTLHTRSLCLGDDADIVIDDDHVLAILQRGQVELWNPAGEIHIGNLPADATAQQMRQATQFWIDGYTTGFKAGRDQAQAQLREAMGIGA